MKNLFFLALFISATAFGQTRTIIVGDIKDSATNEPLAYATIGVKGHGEETISNKEGKFELSVPGEYQNDTLVVTYVGYGRFKKVISQLASIEHILLKEIPTMLDEVRVVHYQLDLRDVDRNARIIKGNLYALENEVTNIEYNTFLNWLDDYNKTDLRKKYDFDLAAYGKSVKRFYTLYHKPSNNKRTRRKDGPDSTINFNQYPVVNISHESAVAYCNWLTERYNENPKKKKFKKVVFRLPTLKEWQIAALGYPKFQSWNILENIVDVTVADDSTAKDWTKGKKMKKQVDQTFSFPWYKVYYYRNTPKNWFNCYLGNFRIDDVYVPCPSGAPAHDGFTMMAFVGAYFPNDMGLYDVCGNVAEMIDEKGKACGGSWNDQPHNSTMQSVKDYTRPDETVGFRIFMEVIEQ